MKALSFGDDLALRNFGITLCIVLKFFLHIKNTKLISMREPLKKIINLVSRYMMILLHCFQALCRELWKGGQGGVPRTNLALFLVLRERNIVFLLLVIIISKQRRH